MSDDHRRSALAHRDPIDAPDGAASLAERAHLTKLTLRGESDEISGVVSTVIRVDLPSATRSNLSGGLKVLWLGPDEWLIVSGDQQADELLSQLSEALSATHYQLVDVTDQLTAISLAGTSAREMLMKLTTLDLHKSKFGPGDVAGSNFGGATATLHMTSDEPPAFDLYVRRSFADYLWCALAEAGREFGLPEQTPRGGEAMRG